MADQVNEAVSTPSEAVYAFGALLTTLSGSLTIGATHDASVMAQMCEAFRLANGWEPPRDNYTDYLARTSLDHLLPEATHPSRGVVDEIIAALDQISGLTRALRNGGPAPEDLQGLSDALTEATNVAWCASRAIQAAALPAVPEGYVLVRRDSIERAAQMAEVFDDGSDGADAETAARVAHDLRGWLIAATPAHDQPEGGES